MKPTPKPPTTAAHDLTLHLVQRPGPITDNCLAMLTGAARGYADGPCKGLVGRIVLEHTADRGMKPRALEADLLRVLEHLQLQLADLPVVFALEVDADAPAFLVAPRLAT